MLDGLSDATACREALGNLNVQMHDARSSVPAYGSLLMEIVIPAFASSNGQPIALGNGFRCTTKSKFGGSAGGSDGIAVGSVATCVGCGDTTAVGSVSAGGFLPRISDRAGPSMRAAAAAISLNVRPLNGLPRCVLL